MDNLQLYRITSLDWKPSPVVALAVSPDGSQVAAAREDGCVEVWVVPPGSVGWNCQLRIQGESVSRVSSLVWLRSEGSGCTGRLLSSSVDGTISEWDLRSLRQKIALDSVGVSVWQMALEPCDDSFYSKKSDMSFVANESINHGSSSDSESTVDDDNGSDSDEVYIVESANESQRLAMACDDGCIRLYNVSNKHELTLNRSFPRVSGRMLSIAWSNDARSIFSGSSDGLIRCWDIASFRELYRITVGLGGLGSGPELCVWSLLYLRSGTLVSGDSTGTVQFWDSRHGTLLQAHTYHKGDVNALATIPGENRVFSAGSDGQVILYKCSNDSLGYEERACHREHTSKWVYVGYVRAHTHDVRALAMTVPVSREDPIPTEKKVRVRRRKKPISYSYHKWAHLGVSMLISGGDDTKLFAYPSKDFCQFAPHDICPAPQPPYIKLVQNSILDGASVMMVQNSFQLEIFVLKLDSNIGVVVSSGRKAATKLLAQIKTKQGMKIISSAVSDTGLLYAYSDPVKPHLLQLKKNKSDKSKCLIDKMPLPKGLPCATFMIFSADSSYLMLAGRDGKIYIVDVNRSEIVHKFIPQRKAENMVSFCEPCLTKLFTSSDGRWLTAINYFGDIFIFNLEVYRQHWFISRLNDASVTAAGFPPNNCSSFVVVTSINEVYVLDVERKQFGEWSRQNTCCLPRRFQEFPGEVIGLCFPPSACSSSVIVYSSRAICCIDLEMPLVQDSDLSNGLDMKLVKAEANISKTKRKRSSDQGLKKSKDFDFLGFRDPVLHVGYLSENALLLIDKPWMEVIKKFEAPIHRHIFGT